MIQITDKSKCCGCNACGDVCTHKAITFKTDIEDFGIRKLIKINVQIVVFVKRSAPICTLRS